MKRSRFSVYMTTGILTVAVIVPVATAFLKDGGHYSETLQDQAFGNQMELKATRRALTRLNARCGRDGEQPSAVCEAYAIVQKECIARQSQYFENTGCPTINDMARIAVVQSAIEMKQPVPAIGDVGSSSSSGSVHAAAGLTIQDLAPDERLAMRRAIRVKYCSKKLPQAMYLLCTSLVDQQQEIPTGLGNDLQQIRSAQRSAQPSTLKDRIEMTKPVVR
ncbi:MAG: hypothetical protein PHX87_02800 [Candidatus Peribacteraceae bacterium]|nr:hypothetical protein [Candidatus Peribacteraceae bacterium]MDD5742337.1 hypothetical protein [Candidatus Peribacteraceae bacterium]